MHAAVHGPVSLVDVFASACCRRGSSFEPRGAGALSGGDQPIGDRHRCLSHVLHVPLTKRRLRLREAKKAQRLAQSDVHGPTPRLRKRPKDRPPAQLPLLMPHELLFILIILFLLLPILVHVHKLFLLFFVVFHFLLHRLFLAHRSIRFGEHIRKLPTRFQLPFVRLRSLRSE